VERVFFPLDEELGLLPGNLAPRQQEHVVQLATWMPLAWAARMLESLVGVQVSKETVRRLTEEAGCSVETAQTAQAQALWQEESAGKRTPVRLAMSADGAYVPLVTGQWAEVRTLAIGEVEEKLNADGTTESHVGHLSYFSRLTDAVSFTDLAEVETRRRKLIQAEQVCAVTDGADWLQSFIDVHRSDALRILDFPHAAEHLNQLLEALEKVGLHFPPGMLERCLHVLKHRGPDPLLRMAQRLSPDLASQEAVREHLGYLCKREHLMQYPAFRKLGWPSGSGMVESANKLVVEVRLKGAGMHWERHTVNPMLALRNGACNGRWQETWQVAGSQARKQGALRRTKRAERRREARLTLRNPALLTSPPPPQLMEPLTTPPGLSPLSVPAATLPGSSRPSAHHPWKRSPACAPKRFAKI
jgi:hypothetical protein